MLTLVKQEKEERDDCNLDVKVEVNIRAECGLSAGECGPHTVTSVFCWLLTWFQCYCLSFYSFGAQRGKPPC